MKTEHDMTVNLEPVERSGGPARVRRNRRGPAIVLALAVAGLAVVAFAVSRGEGADARLEVSADPAAQTQDSNSTANAEAQANTTINRLPEGAKEIQRSTHTGVLGEKITTVLYALPDPAANGRDTSVRLTTSQHERAAESFSEMRASGKESFAGAPLSPVAVGAAEGVTASFPVGEDTVTIVKWLAGSDVDAEITGYNVDLDTLLRVAGQVEI